MFVPCQMDLARPSKIGLFTAQPPWTLSVALDGLRLVSLPLLKLSPRTLDHGREGGRLLVCNLPIL